MESDSIFIERVDVSEALAPVLAKSAQSHMQLVWLIGETGQGKTHFLKHFLDVHREELLTSYAACVSPIGNQSTAELRPHQPLKDIIEDLLASKDNLRRHKNLVKNISLTVLACVPFVGDIAYGIKEIRRDLKEFKSGKRDVELDKFEEEYLQTLVQLSVEAPLLLVIDDIQWADRQSISVLHRLFSSNILGTKRVMLILAGQYDEIKSKPELLDLYNLTVKSDATLEIHLPPFTSSQIEQYYRFRFPNAAPSSDLLLWLEQKTGGNPFFLSSYLKHLVLEEILSEEGEQLADVLSYKGMPAEIRLVTNWLMKSLPEEDLILLLTASVLGYEFSIHELMYLTQHAVLELIRKLRRINSLFGLCAPIGYKLINGKESTVYRFSQHAIHTALYNELTVEEKESLHRAIARYLHQLRLASNEDPEVLNSVASALALHAHLGNDPQLEYDSLLLKARNSSEPVDEEYIVRRINELSPHLGKPAGDLELQYRSVTQMAPYVTHRAEGASIPFVPQEDPETAVMKDSLTSFLLISLEQLRNNDYLSAGRNVRLRIAALKKRQIDVHPLLTILLALAALQEGNFDLRIKEELERLARLPERSFYTVLATLTLTLATSEQDEEVLLRYLTEVSRYRGQYETLLRHVVLYILQTRFAGHTSFRTVLESSPLFAHSTADHESSLQSDFPHTHRLLQKK